MLVRWARKDSASSWLNTSTGTGLPKLAAPRLVLMATTWDFPAAGRKGRSRSRSVTLSNTTKHWAPSASSQLRTNSAVSSRAASGSPMPRRAATIASPFKVLVSFAIRSEPRVGR